MTTLTTSVTDIGECDLGDAPLLELTITDQDGAAADPDTLSVLFRAPVTGTVTTLTYAAGDVTRTGAGVYTVQKQLREAGRWHIRIEAESGSTDAVWDAKEAFVQARSSPFYPDGTMD